MTREAEIARQDDIIAEITDEIRHLKAPSSASAMERANNVFICTRDTDTRINIAHAIEAARADTIEEAVQKVRLLRSHAILTAPSRTDGFKNGSEMALTLAEEHIRALADQVKP